MNKNILYLSFLPLIILFAGCKDHECPPTTQEITISLEGPSLQDASVNSAFTSLNAGTSEKIGATAWTYSGNFGAVRAYIKCDLSTIPADAEIVSATINLYADTTNVPYGHSQLTGTNEWRVKRVTSDWDETLVTWATRPTTDDVNAIGFAATDSARQNFIVDITPMIKDQFAHPNSYYGISLQLVTEVEYRGVMFCSREHRYASKRPTISITYKVKK